MRLDRLNGLKSAHDDVPQCPHRGCRLLAGRVMRLDRLNGLKSAHDDVPQCPHRGCRLLAGRVMRLADATV